MGRYSDLSLIHISKSRKVYDLDENDERIRLPSGNWKSHKEDTVDSVSYTHLTEKGEFNRWIKATNAVIRDIKTQITSLIGWIADMKVELAKP